MKLAVQKKTDYDGHVYPEAHTGCLKILMICTEEKAMTMANGKKFSTGNHPVEMLVPMLHLRNAGFEIDIATPTGALKRRTPSGDSQPRPCSNTPTRTHRQGTAMTNKTLSDHMNWRYATKKMDPTKAVPTEKVDAIIEAARMAPTSSGTQPFELFVITNPEVRGEIRKVAMDQSPITDGSHLLVFAAWDNYTTERIDEVAQLNKDARGELPAIDDYYDNLKALYVPRDAEENYAHAARQAYIALGFAMLAAAEQEVDSTPMEGFDPASVDKILGLAELGLRSVVLLPLGYRDPSGDWLLPMPKVRKSLDTLVTRVDGRLGGESLSV